jgi:glucokinase
MTPHPPLILAGDVGGTKTLVGLFEDATPRPRPIIVERFPTAHARDLEAVLADFLSAQPAREIRSACFGVAGPVRGRTAALTNAPVTVDADRLATRFSLSSVMLISDLVAMAHAVPVLSTNELAVLQSGRAAPDGNAALIAPGTGLGEALLHNISGRFVPMPSEGGHADFAARTPREVELFRYLLTRFGRAEYEHVLSGPGLVNLSRFAHADRVCVAVDSGSPDGALPGLVTEAALAGRCSGCREALDLFVGVLGAEAGNMALRSVATAGVYIGGGIAPSILAALSTATFLSAFRSKAPMADLLADIPLAVILEPESALLGAAVCAAGQ